MHKTLLRIVALLLVPAIMADPAIASALRGALIGGQSPGMAIDASSWKSSRLQEDALSSVALPYFRTRQYSRVETSVHFHQLLDKGRSYFVSHGLPFYEQHHTVIAYIALAGILLLVNIWVLWDYYSKRNQFRPKNPFRTLMSSVQGKYRQDTAPPYSTLGIFQYVPHVTVPHSNGHYTDGSGNANGNGHSHRQTTNPGNSSTFVFKPLERFDEAVPEYRTFENLRGKRADFVPLADVIGHSNGSAANGNGSDHGNHILPAVVQERLNKIARNDGVGLYDNRVRLELHLGNSSSQSEDYPWSAHPIPKEFASTINELAESLSNKTPREIARKVRASLPIKLGWEVEPLSPTLFIVGPGRKDERSPAKIAYWIDLSGEKAKVTDWVTFVSHLNGNFNKGLAYKAKNKINARLLQLAYFPEAWAEPVEELQAPAPEVQPPVDAEIAPEETSSPEIAPEQEVLVRQSLEDRIRHVLSTVPAPLSQSNFRAWYLNHAQELAQANWEALHPDKPLPAGYSLSPRTVAQALPKGPAYAPARSYARRSGAALYFVLNHEAELKRQLTKALTKMSLAQYRLFASDREAFIEALQSRMKPGRLVYHPSDEKKLNDIESIRAARAQGLDDRRPVAVLTQLSLARIRQLWDYADPNAHHAFEPETYADHRDSFKILLGELLDMNYAQATLNEYAPAVVTQPEVAPPTNIKRETPPLSTARSALHDLFPRYSSHVLHFPVLLGAIILGLLVFELPPVHWTFSLTDLYLLISAALIGLAAHFGNDGGRPVDPSSGASDLDSEHASLFGLLVSHLQQARGSRKKPVINKDQWILNLGLETAMESPEGATPQKNNLVTHLLGQGYKHVYGLDPNPHPELAEAQSEIFVKGTAQAIPFQDNTFDIVTSIGLFNSEFFDQVDMQKTGFETRDAYFSQVAREVWRVLKDKGTFLASTAMLGNKDLVEAFRKCGFHVLVLDEKLGFYAFEKQSGKKADPSSVAEAAASKVWEINSALLASFRLPEDASLVPGTSNDEKEEPIVLANVPNILENLQHALGITPIPVSEQINKEEYQELERIIATLKDELFNKAASESPELQVNREESIKNLIRRLTLQFAIAGKLAKQNLVPALQATLMGLHRNLILYGDLLREQSSRAAKKNAAPSGARNWFGEVVKVPVYAGHHVRLDENGVVWVWRSYLYKGVKLPGDDRTMRAPVGQWVPFKSLAKALRGILKHIPQNQQREMLSITIRLAELDLAALTREMNPAHKPSEAAKRLVAGVALWTRRGYQRSKKQLTDDLENVLRVLKIANCTTSGMLALLRRERGILLDRRREILRIGGHLKRGAGLELKKLHQDLRLNESTIRRILFSPLPGLLHEQKTWLRRLETHLERPTYRDPELKHAPVSREPFEAARRAIEAEEELLRQTSGALFPAYSLLRSMWSSFSSSGSQLRAISLLLQKKGLTHSAYALRVAADMLTKSDLSGLPKSVDKMTEKWPQWQDISLAVILGNSSLKFADQRSLFENDIVKTRRDASLPILTRVAEILPGIDLSEKERDKILGSLNAVIHNLTTLPIEEFHQAASAVYGDGAWPLRVGIDLDDRIERARTLWHDTRTALEAVRDHVQESLVDPAEIEERITKSPAKGGAACIVGDLSEDESTQIEEIIRSSHVTHAQRQVIDPKMWEHLDQRLADRVGKTPVYVLPELSKFDDKLIAHAFVGGEVFEQQGIYFSPAQIEHLSRLSPAAQAEFWRHEVLGHLDHPLWTEGQVRALYPLDQVQLEATRGPTVQKGALAEVPGELVSPEKLRDLLQWHHNRGNELRVKLAGAFRQSHEGVLVAMTQDRRNPDNWLLEFRDGSGPVKYEGDVDYLEVRGRLPQGQSPQFQIEFPQVPGTAASAQTSHISPIHSALTKAVIPLMPVVRMAASRAQGDLFSAGPAMTAQMIVPQTPSVSERSGGAALRPHLESGPPDAVEIARVLSLLGVDAAAGVLGAAKAVSVLEKYLKGELSLTDAENQLPKHEVQYPLRPRKWRRADLVMARVFSWYRFRNWLTFSMLDPTVELTGLELYLGVLMQEEAIQLLPESDRRDVALAILEEVRMLFRGEMPEEQLPQKIQEREHGQRQAS